MDNFSKRFGIPDTAFSTIEQIAKMQKAFKLDFAVSPAFKVINTFSKRFEWDGGFTSRIDKMFKMFDWNQTYLPALTDHLKAFEATHTKLFSSWDKLYELNKLDSFGRQLKSMESVLSKVAFQAADVAVRKENLDLLDDFEEITNEVSVISERISEQQAVTNIELAEIRSLIQSIEVRIDQKDRDFFSVVLKWMTVIGFIMMIITEYRYQVSKESNLTKQDLVNFKIEISKTIEEKLAPISDLRCVNRTCNLRPFRKSLVLGIVKEGQRVIVLQTSGKWAFVWIERDSTLHGWVVKKYLDK
ncbi:MAG: SH3 domain-containing protein [Bacteroidetes bacterium]|nr:SH3 domain-containing protein [Bacteroidota bacterium]